MRRGENPAVLRGIRHFDQSIERVYRPYQEDLSRMSTLFDMYFFGPQRPDQVSMPPTTIELRQDNIKRLSTSRISFAPEGFHATIAINAKHVNKMAPWALYEALLHEKLKVFQEMMAHAGIAGFATRSEDYHDLKFVELAQEMGLHPRVGDGLHWKPADGQFEKLMERFGVKKPSAEAVPQDKSGLDWRFPKGKPKGTSTLNRYVPVDTSRCLEKRSCVWYSGRQGKNVICGECRVDIKQAD